MRKLLVILALGLCSAVTAVQQQAPSRLPLTVDRIMRGPALVGDPPSDLRRSGDSRELYFEWRMPNEDEPATWVVWRDQAV